MTDIFGTLGPACTDEKVLSQMFAEGMTGIRINLSHVMLRDCAESIRRIRRAALDNDIDTKILIDMRGPEIRIGKLNEPMTLQEGDIIKVGSEGIPVMETAVKELEINDRILLDDGKILAEVKSVQNGSALLSVKRGGILQSRKSFSIVGKEPDTPAVTDEDMENLRLAAEYGVTGVMQPFVRSLSDLETLRSALNDNGGTDIRIYAKIENMTGVRHLTEFFDIADEIVIARGDLGNAMPLWELPGIQKEISEKCNSHGMPFMVVTQMLASMERREVPTRAEVSDIYNAVLDGASSVMVTGETAVGDHPVEVIRYLSRTAAQVNKDQKRL